MEQAGVEEQKGYEETEEIIDFIQEEEDEQVEAVKEFFGKIETIKTEVPEKKLILKFFNDTLIYNQNLY